MKVYWTKAQAVQPCGEDQNFARSLLAFSVICYIVTIGEGDVFDSFCARSLPVQRKGLSSKTTVQKKSEDSAIPNKTVMVEGVVAEIFNGSSTSEKFRAEYPNTSRIKFGHLLKNTFILKEHTFCFFSIHVSLRVLVSNSNSDPGFESWPRESAYSLPSCSSSL